MHRFTGERKKAKKPKGAPAWMPAMISKPYMMTVDLEKLEGFLPTGTVR